MSNPWLEFRRWCLSIVVLIILLAVIVVLTMNGETLFGAIGAAVVIFYIAGHVIRWIITDRTAPPPANPFTVVPSGPTPGIGAGQVLPFPTAPQPTLADGPSDTGRAA